jgi:hypothetical protein
VAPANHAAVGAKRAAVSNTDIDCDEFICHGFWFDAVADGLFVCTAVTEVGAAIVTPARIAALPPTKILTTDRRACPKRILFAST